MRLPRVRYTIWALMVFVPIVGIALAGTLRYLEMSESERVNFWLIVFSLPLSLALPLYILVALIAWGIVAMIANWGD